MSYPSSKKKDIFDSLSVDQIDLAPYDVLDDVELDTEDKILYSKELKNILREELSKKIAEIPFNKIIQDIVSKQLEQKDYPALINKKTDSLEQKLEQEKFRSNFKLKEDLDKLSREIKEKYAEFRNILNSQEKYTFGGFPLKSSPYSTSNGTTTRSFDALNTSLDELSSVVATLIADLKTAGLLG